MLHLILALAPLFALEEPVPPPAQVKSAIAELDKAFKDGGTPERLKAIQQGSQVLDAEVIGRIAKGLRDKEADVGRAAIEALRFMNHPEATRALLDAAKREPRLKKNLDLYASLLRAIGQHGDASSIEVLTDDIWTTLEYPVLQARILGLGRIRTKASVEKLFDLMRSAGPYKIQPHMGLFRTSLMVLTGVDHGTSSEAWMKWWNQSRAKLEIEAKAAPLPKATQYAWDLYWGENRPMDRPEKRGERGRDDPEK
ncbi:MAG: HEAT repeat domain-containing protein [Planctomycetes bacterium]|nr:HEAT repeat domain-containing protein [Planctomycetota bacterium]